MGTFTILRARTSFGSTSRRCCARSTRGCRWVLLLVAHGQLRVGVRHQQPLRPGLHRLHDSATDHQGQRLLVRACRARERAGGLKQSMSASYGEATMTKARLVPLYFASAQDPAHIRMTPTMSAPSQ